tara:strand:+ start:291 stop:6629 length:6339 start_codon:yes stop_codon:yes gene_type:complete
MPSVSVQGPDEKTYNIEVPESFLQLNPAEQNFQINKIMPSLIRDFEKNETIDSPKEDLVTKETLPFEEEDKAFEEDDEVGFFEEIGNSLGRGGQHLTSGLAVLGNRVGLVSDEAAAEQVAQDKEDLKDYEMSDQLKGELGQILEAESLGDAAWEAITNPEAVLNIAVQSLVSSVPSIAGMIGGGFVGSLVAPGVGTIAGMVSGSGLGSYGVEWSNSIIQAMDEDGLDTQDPGIVLDFLNDEQKMGKARSFAEKRAIPIAVFDGISAGIAGRILTPARKLMAGKEGTKVALQAGRKAEQEVIEKGIIGIAGKGSQFGSEVAKEVAKKKVARAGILARNTATSQSLGKKTLIPALGAEVAAQGTLGGLGEATAQLVSEGEITGYGDIVLEAFAELPSGAVEAGVGVFFDRRNEIRLKEEGIINEEKLDDTSTDFVPSVDEDAGDVSFNETSSGANNYLDDPTINQDVKIGSSSDGVIVGEDENIAQSMINSNINNFTSNEEVVVAPYSSWKKSNPAFRKERYQIKGSFGSLSNVSFDSEEKANNVASIINEKIAPSIDKRNETFERVSAKKKIIDFNKKENEKARKEKITRPALPTSFESITEKEVNSYIEDNPISFSADEYAKARQLALRERKVKKPITKFQTKIQKEVGVDARTAKDLKNFLEVEKVINKDGSKPLIASNTKIDQMAEILDPEGLIEAAERKAVQSESFNFDSNKKEGENKSSPQVQQDNEINANFTKRYTNQFVENLGEGFIGKLYDTFTQRTQINPENLSIRFVRDVDGDPNGSILRSNNGKVIIDLATKGLVGRNQLDQKKLINENMNHEIFHVVRNLSRVNKGPLDSKDLNTLARFTKNNKSRTTNGKTYYENALDVYGSDPIYQKGGAVDIEAIQDEADAHAYEDWSKGIKNQSVTDSIFRSLQNFILDIVNSLKGQGFNSVDGVFKKVEDLSPDSVIPDKVVNQRQSFDDKIKIELKKRIDNKSGEVSIDAIEAAKTTANKDSIYIKEPKFKISKEAIDQLPVRKAVRDKTVSNYSSRMTDQKRLNAPQFGETIFDLQKITSLSKKIKKGLFTARTSFVNDLDYVTKMQKEVAQEFGNNFADTAAEAAVQMAKNHNAILSNSLTIGVPKYNSAVSETDDPKGYTFNDSTTATITKVDGTTEEVEINGLIEIFSSVLDGITPENPQYKEILTAIGYDNSVIEKGDKIDLEESFHAYLIALRSIEIYERSLNESRQQADAYSAEIQDIMKTRVSLYGENVNVSEEVKRDLRNTFPKGSPLELDSKLEENLIKLMSQQYKKPLPDAQFAEELTNTIREYTDKIPDAKVLGPIEEHRTIAERFNKFEIYNETAQKFSAFNKGMIEYMKNTGLISAEEASAYSQTSAYIPFFREFDVEPGMINASLKDMNSVINSVEGVGNQIDIRPLKGIKGKGSVYRITIDGVPQGKGYASLDSIAADYKKYQKDGAKYGIAETESISIEEGGAPIGGMFNNIAINLSNVIKSGMRNVALQRIVRDGLNLNTIKSTEEGEEVFVGATLSKDEEGANTSVRVNGKEQKFFVHDPLLMKALESIGDDQAFISQYKTVEMILTSPANVLRDLITREPGFILANGFRDSLAAFVTSGRDITPILGTLKGAIDAFNNDPSAQSLKKAGIKGGFDFSITSDARIPNEIEKEIKKQFPSKRSKKEKALRFTGLYQLWDQLGKVTEYSDLATRIAVYNDVLAKTGNQAQAVYEAQEILNFRRRGRYMKTMSAITPFLNARIQGLDVLYRGFTGRAASTNAELSSSDMKKLFLIRASMLVTLSSVIWMMNAGDEDWESVDDATQDNNWIILGKHIPFLPDDYNVKLPIPFEIGFIFKTIPERLLDYSFGSTTFEALMESTRRGLHEATSVQLPTTISPLAEWIFNYSFYQGRPLLTYQETQMYPASDVIRASTSDLAIQASKLLGKGPVPIQISPVEIDNIIRGYGGTASLYVLSLVDALVSTASEVERPSKRFTDAPFISRFLMDNTEARGVTGDVFKLNNYYSKVARRLSRASEYGNQDAVFEMLNGDLSNYYALGPDIKYLRKNLIDINKRLKMLQSSDFSQEFKDEQRVLLEAARKNQTDMVQLVNRRVKEGAK